MPNIKVVIGANYGDEGKGFVTNWLASQSSGGSGIVVMSNGGPQRGHTVQVDGKPRTVFHHLGSASYHGFDTYFPQDYIINPAVFNHELDEFVDKDKIKVFVNYNCKFTTPFDMELNQRELHKSSNTNSCGMGIWKTLERYNTLPSLTWYRFIDSHRQRTNLYSYYKFSEWISQIYGLEYYSASLADQVLEYFHHDCLSMTYKCHLADNFRLIDYKNIIFENGQGLGLDQNIAGQENFTTPSNTGIANPVSMIESVFEGEEVEVIYVTRSYLTRHGRGPMDNEDASIFFEDETNIPNKFQGSLRFGRLDVDKMLDRIKNDMNIVPKNARNKYNVSIAMTHLDEMQVESDIEKIKKNVDAVYLFKKEDATC